MVSNKVMQVSFEFIKVKPIFIFQQANYLIRIGRYEPAMMYLMTTLEMEKEKSDLTVTLVS